MTDNGSRDIWLPLDDCQIRDGFLVGKPRYSGAYRPMDHPRILTDFANVQWGDEKSVLTFAQQRGNLGHVGYNNWDPYHGKTRELREPVKWIWTHASILKTCLTFLEYLKRKDIDGLGNYLISLSPDFPDGMDVAHLKGVPESLGVELAPGFGGDAMGVVRHFDHNTVSFEERWPELAAVYLIQGVVNKGLDGDYYTGKLEGVPTEALHPRLEITRTEGHCALFYTFSSLLQVMYWQLAQSVINRGEHLARCEACGKFFTSDNHKQRYCPRDTGEQGVNRASPCALRAAKRRQRQRDRERRGAK